jgi:hypothetical protein|tara:strand:- start:1318 stop:2247 length:930 start_codon:yes stop_codon:yes gene_type:complete
MNLIAIKDVYRTHPIPPEFVIVDWEDIESRESADIYIQANIAENKHKKLRHKYEYIRTSAKPWIVVESAVFRRNMYQPPNPKAYHRFSWFSYFRDEGLYNNINRPSDRWDQIQRDQNIQIKDWRSDGEYILVLLQRPGDSSLKNLLARYGTYEVFLASVIEEIRKHTNRPIRIRMHPLRQDKQLTIIENLNLSGIELSPNTQGAELLEGGDGLYEDFKNAWAVVGFNSNALTESVCEGVPTFSLCPSSMAWECSNTDLKNIDNPQFFDRQQWLYNLGYCQWREDEIAQSAPLHHLMEIYNQAKMYIQNA